MGFNMSKYLCILLSSDGTVSVEKALAPYTQDSTDPVMVEKFHFSSRHVEDSLQQVGIGTSIFYHELKAKVKTAVVCGITNINIYVKGDIRNDCIKSIELEVKAIEDQLSLNKVGFKQLSLYRI